MDSISVDSLAPGTYFDAPVYLEKGFILLSPDSPVTQELIQRLRKWEYAIVYTEGKPASAPQETAPEPESTPSEQPTDTTEKTLISDTQVKFYLEQLKFTRTQLRRSGELQIPQIYEHMKLLITAIKSSKDFLPHFSEIDYPAEDYLITHSLHVAILNIGIGNSPPLSLALHRLIEVGMAGLLHDIGMTRIPEQIYLSGNPLTPQGKKTLFSHPILGYNLLKGFSFPVEVKLAALEHHERLNGSGYPRGLSGGEISLYGNITAVACAYDALIATRKYTESLNDPRTVGDLLKARRILFDDEPIRALLHCVSIFPLGTIVLLSNRAIGVVARPNPQAPRHPTIKLLLDENGKRLTEEAFVETSPESDVKIVRSLLKEEILKKR